MKKIKTYFKNYIYNHVLNVNVVNLFYMNAITFNALNAANTKVIIYVKYVIKNMIAYNL